ncbi:hypothetical protein VV02_11670 [Luteipulveratus mongoliensis]|uniref:Integral membrane protein n=2 Tax=Luteipulveratus mongoliensis TaxID=571913 RepID=A0A0K1JQM7_9MICO|nr:hypothetical protein VV02_11670 [Luteipulveratus mongoliensis]
MATAEVAAPSPPAQTMTTLWIYRVVSVLHALLMVAQPILIGRFLEGDFGSLSAHAAVGGIAMLSATLLLVAGVLVWRPGRLGLQPLIWSAAMFVLIPAQLAMGYTRTTSVHIPLGVAIVAGSVALVVWACRPGRARMSWRPRTPVEPVR